MSCLRVYITTAIRSPWNASARAMSSVKSEQEWRAMLSPEQVLFSASMLSVCLSLNCCVRTSFVSFVRRAPKHQEQENSNIIKNQTCTHAQIATHFYTKT